MPKKGQNFLTPPMIDHLSIIATCKQDDYSPNLRRYSVDGDRKRMELKERLHIQRLFQERGRNDVNSTTLANTLDKDIQTVFNSPEKLALELLQNADDAGSQDQPVDVTFRLAQHYLAFSHTGKQFDEQDVDAICDNAQQRIATKKLDLTKTGYKGIGFKSVFVVSDCTYIISANYQFRFDRHYPRWKSSQYSDGTSAYPWQIIPIWTPSQQLPKDIAIDQSQVNFLIHLNQHGDTVKRHLQDMIKTPTISLFLRHIHSITLDIYGQIDVIRVVKSTDRYQPYQIVHNDQLISLWLMMTDNIAIPQTVRHQMQQLSDQECPPKLKNASTVTIQLAYYLRQKNQLNTLDNATLFCYLPTQLKCGLSCLVNADFLLTADRMQLLQNDWNRFLFRCIARFHIASLHQLAQHKVYRYFILNLFTPQLQPYFATYFKSAYDQVVKEQLNNVPFIPSQLDPNRLLLWHTAINDHLVKFYQAFPGIDPDQERNIASYKLTNQSKLLLKFTWDDLANKMEQYASQCHQLSRYKDLIVFLIDIHRQSESSSKRLNNRWKGFDTKRFLLADNNQLMTSQQVYLPKDSSQKYPSMIAIRLIHPMILKITDSISWLQAIGVKPIDQQCIIQEIESMIGNASNSLTFKVSLEVIQFLCSAVNTGMICIKPDSNLHRLPLLTKSGTLKRACDCYLPSSLGPQFDLETLITIDIGFVSIKSYTGVKSNSLKQVLLHLGVAQTIAFYCGIFIQHTTEINNIDRFQDYQSFLSHKAGINQQHHFTYHIAYLPYMRCLNQDSYAKLFFQHIIQHQQILIQELREFKICCHNGRKRRYNYSGQHYLHFMLNDRPCIKGTNGKLYRMHQLYIPSVIQQLGPSLGQLLPQMKTQFDNITIELPNELMAALGARTVLTIDDIIKLFEYITKCNRLQYFELFSNLYKVIISATWNQQNTMLLHRYNTKLLAADGTLQVAKSLYFIATPNVYAESHHYLLKQPNELSVQDMLIISDRLNVRIIKDNDYIIQCKESKINHNMKQFIVNLLNIVVITVDDSKKNKRCILTDWHRSLKKINFMEVTQLVMKSPTDPRLHFKVKTALTNQKLLFEANSNNCKDRILEMIGNYLRLSLQTMHVLGLIHGKSKAERLEWLEERNYNINVIDSLKVDPQWNASNLLQMNDSASSRYRSLLEPLMGNDVEIIPSEVHQVDFSQVRVQSKMDGNSTRLASPMMDLTHDHSSVRASLRKGILSLLCPDRNTMQEDVNRCYPNPAKVTTEQCESNHWTGRWGEEFMYYYFQRYYQRVYSFANQTNDTNGRFTMTGTTPTGNNLQLQVIWWNCHSESGKPYDFEIIVNHRIIYIEVKTTYKANLMRAKVSRNEWQAMRHYGKDYHLYCVFNAGQANNIRIEVISDPASKFYQGKLNPSEMFFNI